jgi:hypothetical protein
MNLKKNCCRTTQEHANQSKKTTARPKNQGSKQAMETNQLKAAFENAEG